jgi:hypothetical protein
MPMTPIVMKSFEPRRSQVCAGIAASAAKITATYADSP